MDNTTAISPNDLDSPSFFTSHLDSFEPDHASIDGNFAELSNALAAHNAPSNQYESWSFDSAFRDLSNNSTTASSPFTPGTPIIAPKLGNRFSRDVIRTLKSWLTVHQHHPYPTDGEMIVIQNQTGLNKAQIMNWFANARRRGKVQTLRPASPQVRDVSTNPMDIIPRPSTPAFKQTSRSQDPMQRWVDSPPEHEPADVGDIARAMASSSRPSHLTDVDNFAQSLNHPWQSPYNRSSASSVGTSHSSEFSGRHSSGSQSSLKVRRPPRRKRHNRRRRIGMEAFADPRMPYQCTFCTEVFKTKYDWQRHEKSVHLPLEHWVCALHGPRAAKQDVVELCCVFCGEPAPDDAHIEAHHYSACQQRSLEERTFHRKDHLVQHLGLVHNAKFTVWSMKPWMLSMPNIQSRCGFCRITMSTWLERTDHLADHFKAGATMAEWQGDWGFDETILDMVESALPPYFIDYERSTLIPMKGTDPPYGTPPNSYELLKVETEFFAQKYFDKHGQWPTNDAMQLEACRIIFTAEAIADMQSSTTQTNPGYSWLRDLIMSSPELARQARFGPIRTSSESRHYPLKINGKDYLFELCPLEAQLHAFVSIQQLSNAVIGDGQILNEASAIIKRLEQESTTPSDMFANWLVKGIYSANWLAKFKRRAGVSDVSDVINFASKTCSKANWGTHWPQALLPALAASTTEVTHAVTKTDSANQDLYTFAEAPFAPPTTTADAGLYVQSRPFLPDDTNFYRCFESDIKRWVAATMSPKNPNSHIPSDEEIQHQARWIMYGGDDAWNQTPADYAEWLWRFKKDLGIVTGVDAVDPAELTRHQ